MSTETATVETAVETPIAKAKKASTKAKAAAKKPAKATKKTSAKDKTVGEYGIEKSKDLPWCDKKVKIFQKLKALGAFNLTSARSTNELAEKTGLTTRDIRHYCYHAMAAELVGYTPAEEGRGYSFWLTAKGAKIDPVAEFKAQKAK